MTHILFLIFFIFTFFSAIANNDSTQTTIRPVLLAGFQGSYLGYFGFAPSIFVGVNFPVITSKKIATIHKIENGKINFIRKEISVIRIKNTTKMKIGASTGSLFMVSVINETHIRLFGIIKDKASLQFVPFIQLVKVDYMGSKSYKSSSADILVGAGLSIETSKFNFGFNTTFNKIVLKNYDLSNKTATNVVGFNLSYFLN